MFKKLLLMVLITNGFFYVSLANAVNLRWLNYSPVKYFSDQDWQLFRDAGKKALNQTSIGQSITWSNEKTGNSGKVTPFDESYKNRMDCRKILIEINSNKGTSSKGRYQFCRQKNGLWALVES